MVTAGEIVTDDRWAAAAVSRRTRIKSWGFCPNVASVPVVQTVPTPLLLYQWYNTTTITIITCIDVDCRPILIIIVAVLLVLCLVQCTSAMCITLGPHVLRVFISRRCFVLSSIQSKNTHQYSALHQSFICYKSRM